MPNVVVVGTQWGDEGKGKIVDLLTEQAAMVARATPRPIVQRLNREFLWVLDQPDVRQRMIDTGLEPAGSTPEAFDEFLAREYAKYGQVLKEAGIKPE